MKNLTKKLSYAIYMVLVAFMFTSCEHKQETLDNYCNGVIYGKLSNLNGDMAFKIRVDKEVKLVYVYSLDWNKYELGDKVNCN